MEDLYGTTTKNSKNVLDITSRSIRCNSSQNGFLNLNHLNSSKVSSTNSGTTSGQTKTTGLDTSHHDLNTTNISPISGNESTARRQLHSSYHNGGLAIAKKQGNKSRQAPNESKLMLVTTKTGVKEMISSLGLLCLVSILLALLSLLFFLKICPSTATRKSEYVIVYEVTLGMLSSSYPNVRQGKKLKEIDRYNIQYSIFILAGNLSKQERAL